MKFSIVLIIIFLSIVSLAAGVDDYIRAGDYAGAYEYLVNHYGNDTGAPEYLFLQGKSELSGENSAAYLKDFLNKSTKDTYVADWSRLLLGKYYLAQRLYVAAAKQLESIPDGSPFFAQANFLAGCCYLYSGELDRATKKLESIIDHGQQANKRGADQDFADWADLKLADTYLVRGEYSRADGEYQSLLRPELENDIYALALLGLAESARAQKKEIDAERYSGLFRERYKSGALITPAEDKTSSKTPEQPDNKPSNQEKSSAGRFYIQVGAYSNKDNALRTASLYKENGYNVYMDTSRENGHDFYRILVGGYSSRQQAEFIQKRLEKASGEKYLLLQR